MKIFFVLLILISSFYQIKALPHNLDRISGSWEDTQKKLTDLSEKVAEQMSWAEVEISKIEMQFSNRLVERIVTFFSELGEAALKYIVEYEQWINKAKEAKIDPSNCTEDKWEIELQLPYEAIQNVTNLIQIRWEDTVVQVVFIVQNLTFIPMNLKDEQLILNHCNKTDEKCIKQIDDTLEGFKTYPEQIRELVNDLSAIYVKLMEIVDTCIVDSVKYFDKEEALLTGKGIRCIKDLINQ